MVLDNLETCGNKTENLGITLQEFKTTGRILNGNKKKAWNRFPRLQV
jgi:hypothetical protein